MLSPCQGEGRGFESRLALTKSLDFQGVFCCADMCTVCALLFYILFVAIFQSFIHDIKVLLFGIGIVNITKSSTFIDLPENFHYLIQGHSFRTQEACSCSSCAMRIFKYFKFRLSVLTHQGSLTCQRVVMEPLSFQYLQYRILVRIPSRAYSLKVRRLTLPYGFSNNMIDSFQQNDLISKSLQFSRAVSEVITNFILYIKRLSGFRFN